MANIAARFEIAPRCALSRMQAGVFFASTCALTLAIAVPFALQGFWPVLPFAGLEMAVLGWALRVSLARRDEREIITVTDHDVVVEADTARSHSRTVFQRYWAQVRMRRAVSPLHPSRLTIESHGRQREVGSFLTEQERRALSSRLQRLVGRVSESPALPADGT